MICILEATLSSAYRARMTVGPNKQSPRLRHSPKTQTLLKVSVPKQRGLYVFSVFVYIEMVDEDGNRFIYKQEGLEKTIIELGNISPEDWFS